MKKFLFHSIPELVFDSIVMAVLLIVMVLMTATLRADEPTAVVEGKGIKVYRFECPAPNDDLIMIIETHQEKNVRIIDDIKVISVTGRPFSADQKKRAIKVADPQAKHLRTYPDIELWTSTEGLTHVTDRTVEHLRKHLLTKEQKEDLVRKNE